MPKTKYPSKNGKRKSKLQVVQVKGKTRQRINWTTDELLEASQILGVYMRSGKLIITSQSPKVKKFVGRAASLNNPKKVQLSLNKVNEMIVDRNAKENQPTEAVKRIYQTILEE